MRAPLLVLIGLLAGCGTLNSARPLDPGEKAVGVTLGGPIVDAGFVTMPLPSLVVQGKGGVGQLAGRNVEVDLGLNATGLPFGIVGLHGGVSWLAMDQKGAVPALALTNRLFVYNNFLAGGRAEGTRAATAVDQLELTLSWDTEPVLVYTGVGQLTDLRRPSLVLAPMLGAETRLGSGWPLQLASRWYGVNRVQEQNGISWVSPGEGALGATFSVGKRFGGGQ